MIENTTLSDTDSHEYNALGAHAQGVQFEDNSDITSNNAFVEGSTFTDVFELPINASPSSITLAYYYGGSWGDYSNPSFAQLHVNLINSEKPNAVVHFDPGNRVAAAIDIICPDSPDCTCTIPQGTLGTVLCYDAE